MSVSSFMIDDLSEYRIIGSKPFCPQNFKDVILFLALIVAGKKFDVNLIYYNFVGILFTETFKIFSFSLRI